MNLIVAILLGLLVLAVVLYALDYIAPPEVNRIARVVVVVLFLIWLVRLAWPLLGVT